MGSLCPRQGAPRVCPSSATSQDSLPRPQAQVTSSRSGLWAGPFCSICLCKHRLVYPPQSPDMYVPCHFPFTAEETKAQRGSATSWRPHDKGAGRTQTQIHVTLKRTPSDRWCCFSVADVQGPLF